MKKGKNIVGEGRAYGLMIGLMGLIVLMGCSKDEVPSGGSNGEPAGTALVEVASYVRWYDEAYGANRAHEDNKVNRAWAIPSGYVAYEGGEQSIGIAFTKDGVDPTTSMIGNFFKSGGKWRTDLTIGSGDYYLYGYIPHQTAINYSITDYNGANGSYSTGAIMTLQNVPTVMPNDLCVVIGAKHGTDKEHDSGLRQGDFSFTAKQGTDSKDYVFLLFDHLYAALRIRMRVHDDYAALRTIKLKSLQLNTQAGNETTKKRTDITIKLRATDGSVSPIKEITYGQPATPYPAIEGGLEFWSSTYGEQLTTAFKPFIGHFMPRGITKLILTSVYDVYDKNVTPEHPDGNLIRQDCKATNTMVLQDLLTGQTVTERGKRYTIDMTIQPTYLYMLSEPDLDNPTVTINNN